MCTRASAGEAFVERMRKERRRLSWGDVTIESEDKGERRDTTDKRGGRTVFCETRNASYSIRMVGAPGASLA